MSHSSLSHVGPAWAPIDSHGRAADQAPTLKKLLVASCLAFATLLELYGTVADAIFCAITLALLLQCVLDRTFRPNWVVLMLPCFVVASTLWSDEPMITLRVSVILLVCVVAITLCCNSISPRTLVLWLSLALYCSLPLQLVFGQNFWNSGFGGLMGSKNYFAGRMMITLFFALGIIVDRNHRASVKFVSAVAAVVSVYGIVIANSAGAFIATALSIGVFSCASILTIRNPRTLGVILMVLLVVSTAALVVFALAWSDIQSGVLTLFSKDAGLTGRDYLWHRAYLYIADRPVLGTGFGAFWVQGNIEAEGLWRAMSIGSRMGFHFHNLFLNVAVELGLLGLFVAVAFMVAVTVATVRYAWRRGDQAAVFSALIAMFLIRSYVEVDFPKEFQLFCMLIFGIACYTTLQRDPRWIA